jgi:amino acid adenylation domain-containing protein
MILHDYLENSARAWHDRIAVQEAQGGALTYGELDRLSGRLRDWLWRQGVQTGDRVGIWIAKSADSIAAILGALRAGAAYVPVDPTAPYARNGYILADCSISAVIVESRYKAGLLAELDRHGSRPAVLEIAGHGGGRYLHDALTGTETGERRSARAGKGPGPDDLAYILYTSGSTGRPKGVMLTHRNAVSFVEWCARVLAPTSEDRFSSHAPFHFDLSILDIYTPIRHGATVVLIGEEAGKNPSELAHLIAETGITVWYSAPSILSLLAQYGGLDGHRCASLRAVLFAGEVFPIKHLKTLTRQWPHPRYLNLYGPTETNVCTYYEVPLPIPETQTEPVPIGRICDHLEGVVIDPDTREPLPKGAEGELCIRGPNVTRGYWHLAEQTAKAFVTVGAPPAYYRTGDIVVERPDGNFRYLGRKDRMIKKRGYRVELGEIEACLYAHPKIREAAVVAVADELLGMKVHAHISCKDGGRLSLIELKKFCSDRIPLYMIPDAFSFHAGLPRTSTDKVDYQGLIELCRN